MTSLTILGATGSIGQSTLAVISQYPERYRVFALTAHQNHQLLAEQCLAFNPQYAVVADASVAATLQQSLRQHKCGTEVLSGPQALEDVAKAAEVDIVMAAIVGAAGLMPTLAAVTAGKKVLLANKEALVMSGHLFNRAVNENGAVLLPIDSEHNAIFQCLPQGFRSLDEAGVSKILLTGSGGPFRDTPLAALAQVTPDQACAHPNWSMGRKISVDSATMMNKGLEFIEARWLFNADNDQIEVVVHPQSIIHSMVQYRDGSVLAQMGQPDMRTPIAHCLAWPERMHSGVAPLDFTALGPLTFEAPDYQHFPCLRLALQAGRDGADYPTALNAANEVAVELFLASALQFTQIAQVIAEVMQIWSASEPESIHAVIDADQRARRSARAIAQSFIH